VTISPLQGASCLSGDAPRAARKGERAERRDDQRPLEGSGTAFGLNTISKSFAKAKVGSIARLGR
jgi:hypothetical protein